MAKFDKVAAKQAKTEAKRAQIAALNANLVARLALGECEDDGWEGCQCVVCEAKRVVRMDPPAAACPQCGGWTGYGGMSQFSKSATPVLGRTGCACHGSLDNADHSYGYCTTRFSL